MFQQTALYQRVESDTIDLPEDKPISNVNPVPVPIVFLADDAFALSRKIMCPYIENPLTLKKEFSTTVIAEEDVL